MILLFQELFEAGYHGENSMSQDFIMRKLISRYYGAFPISSPVFVQYSCKHGGSPMALGCPDYHFLCMLSDEIIQSAGMSRKSYVHKVGE